MLEYVNKYFDLGSLKESPHMSFALPAKDKAKKEVPSIIHVDGTSRMQTVTKEQNKHYYNLIKEFYKYSKVPMILNTSFNVAGFPIVEDIDFAIWSCKKMNIELIYNPQ